MNVWIYYTCSLAVRTKVLKLPFQAFQHCESITADAAELQELGLWSKSIYFKTIGKIMDIFLNANVHIKFIVLLSPLGIWLLYCTLK